jgi:predicted nucleic acid-binding Zn ribbon protein
MWGNQLVVPRYRSEGYRKRLEALRDGRAPKRCLVCGALVADRADAVYCGDVCRLRAHRHRINRAARVRMLLDVVKAPVALSGGPAWAMSW